MDPIDAEVGEDEEEGELKVVIVGVWFVCENVVEFAVSADFREEERDGKDRDPGHGADGLFYFHADLILQELRVLEGGFVEDEDVGEGGDDEVNCGAGDPINKLESVQRMSGVCENHTM